MQQLAKDVLKQLTDAGFDAARVTIAEDEVNELGVAHNHVSLMRSTNSQALSLLGIQDQRKVTASVSSLETDAIKNVIDGMVRDVKTSPQDPANAVAPNQTGVFNKGPQTVDREALALAAKNFLAFRSSNYPTFQIEEASIKHSLSKTTLLTSEGTELVSNVGEYEFSIMGSSKDEHGSSSFNYTGGSVDVLPENLVAHFDLEALMANSVQETQTELVGDKFEGEVVLMPMAVMDLLGWLAGQIGDFALLSDASVYKNSVDSLVASDKLSVRANLAGAGVSPINAEGFVVEPINLIENGKLKHLLPSYYGSRKLNKPYVAAPGGWSIDAGDVSRQEMIASVQRGAVVSRLSMGSPAPNGDFSGVIKNSFLIEDGKRTKALSETMITGNVAQMLKDIIAISSEVTDFGGYKVPWLQIKGLRFS
ncbi:metallopeptidase TldD-related protein [Salinibius halmophilus]|uniref:metallopeptidase TldD-related protein n=1 Tax=Salinibius halmophilus TaxID=1853216 RepID=UPI000E662FB0|nr:metallopeptidase TldD-related protein [Salinibius halmophilus]